MKDMRYSILPAAIAVGLATAMILLTQSSHAAVLVKDSFDALGYTVGTGLKNLSPGNTTGFTSKNWGTGSSTGVFFVNDGLSLPQDFTAKAAGNAIGVGKFSSDPTGNLFGRRITRTIDDNVIPASGTYYFRFACALGAAAEKFLRPNDFEALGLVPSALTDTDGTGVPPTIGIHLGFNKTAAKGSTGTDIALWIAGTRTNLVSNITAGKTYIVVAKIEIASDGTASVSALAGASDDADLRSASLPEPVTGSVGTSPLRHLCLSGVYMTGYDSGKYATFDEIAIGETLSEVFEFSAAGAPIVRSSDATSIGETGFTANGTLEDLGSSSPELFFDLSGDGGSTWTPTSMGTYSSIGAISNNATGLLSGSTYLWRFRAEGSTLASTSLVQTVTTAGAPVFGEPSVTFNANDATLAVSLTTPGLSGVAPTTVELWFAPAGEALALHKTFDTVTAAADFSETISALSWGELYRCAFRGSVPYNSGTLVTWTATNTVEVVGTNIWTAGAGTTDWHTAGNWGFNTVPTALLSAKFADVGGLVTADENAVADSVYVNTRDGGTIFDLHGNELTANWFGIGYHVSRSFATISNGVFNIQQLRVGGSQGNTLVVGDGSDLRVGGSLYVAEDNDPVYASNKVVFARGSKTTVNGTFFLRTAREVRAVVEAGASVTTKGLQCPALPVGLIVDGGAFTNTSTTIMINSHRRGSLVDPMFLEFRNGATGRFNDKMYVNSALNNSGGRYHAEVRVLSGATLDAKDGIYLDHNGSEGSTGSGEDSGGGAAVVVSNATLKAKTLNIAVDDRRNGDELRIYEDEGENTLVEIGGSVRVSSSSWSRSDKCNYDHRILVEGGALAIAENLQLGDGGQYYDQHDGNHLEIKRANARVTLGALNVYGKSYVSFTIPSGGFSQVPLQLTGKADFGIVPTGAEAAFSEVHVDATGFTGTQTLITAGSLAGLAEGRVAVTAARSMKVRVRLTETSLSVTVSPSATFIIVR